MNVIAIFKSETECGYFFLCLLYLLLRIYRLLLFPVCQSAGFFLAAVVSLIVFGDQHDEDHDNQWQQLDFLKHLLWVYLMIDDFHRFFSLSLVITLPLGLVIIHIFRG